LDALPGEGLLIFQGGEPKDGRKLARSLPRLLPPWRVHDVQPGVVADESVIIVQLAPTPDDVSRVDGATSYSMIPELLEKLGDTVNGGELRHVPPRRRGPDNMLIGMGAAVDRYGLVVPTLAGVLALGRWPSALVDGARVRVTVDGQSRWFDSSLSEMLRDVARIPALHEGLEPDVVFELVLNAFVHRCWHPDTWQQPVEVIRQGHRLEVRSPGTLEDGAAPGRATKRNPVLIELLQRLQLFEGKGKGLLGAAKLVRGLGGEGPELSTHEGMVRQVVQLPAPKLVDAERIEQPIPLTALGRAVAQVEEPMDSSAEEVSLEPEHEPEPQVERVPQVSLEQKEAAPARSRAQPTEALTGSYRKTEQREVELVAMLEAKGSMTTRELYEALGWSRSTTRNVIVALETQGVVRSQRASSRSPHQAWRLGR